jgi:hypothetical protein
MQNKGLSQWHWLFIGLVMGVLAAWIRVQFGLVGSAEMRPGITATQFAALAGQQNASPDKSVLRNVVIYPSEGNKNYVTGEANLLAGSTFQFNASRPFAAGGVTSSDVQQFLKDRYPHVQFRYLWWASPRAQAPLWAFGTFALIGIIWPTVRRARFGESNEPKTADSGTASSSTAPPPIVPAADVAALDELVATMSADNPAPAAVEEAPAQVAASIVTLDAMPLAAVESEPDEAKRYRGEFYPVSRDKRAK